MVVVEEDGARGGGVTRRACSRDRRLDWPFSGVVGNHRIAIPLNSPSGAGCFLTGDPSKVIVIVATS